MGTRGAFGVIIGEQEKISYNGFDSYIDGKGVENLRWLREAIATEGGLETIQKLAADCRLVSGEKKPTKSQKAKLAATTQSTDSWYGLTQGTTGDIGAMLECGYILDSHAFPLDSLFCEWTYLVDFDRGVFEVYKGFQEELPKQGRWAGRPTPEEDTYNYKEHLYWCAENGRAPWLPKISEYKGSELVGSFPFDALPSDEEFLAWDAELGELGEEQDRAEIGLGVAS